LIFASDIRGGSGSLRHGAPPMTVPTDLVRDDVPHRLERLEHMLPDTLIFMTVKEAHMDGLSAECHSRR
jgi:hypothetical protein